MSLTSFTDCTPPILNQLDLVLPNHLVIYTRRLYDHYMRKPLSERPLALRRVERVQVYARRMFNLIALNDNEAISECSNYPIVLYKLIDQAAANIDDPLLSELTEFGQHIVFVDRLVEEPTNLDQVMQHARVPIYQHSITPWQEYHCADNDSCNIDDYSQLKLLNFNLDAHLELYVCRLYSYYRRQQTQRVELEKVDKLVIFELHKFLELFIPADKLAARLKALTQDPGAPLIMYSLNDPSVKPFQLLQELEPFKHRIFLIHGSFKTIQPSYVRRVFPQFFDQ